ncbi:GNAT family N-acetyltransferase [Pseudoxanthomonas sp. PXM01]|nr:GNAT family N-acetyltransferase [Pseudoxanthomonas sp. PXM01]
MGIRQATANDLSSMWDIFRSIISAGDALPFSEQFTRETFQSHWFGSHTAYVAVIGADVLGMYKLGANYPDSGNHVASATYLVRPVAQGSGVGTALVQHSLAQARKEGFMAMQFNYVVSSNRAAVELYKRFGFFIAGTLPKAFRHKQLGHVDAYVMYRFLESET